MLWIILLLIILFLAGILLSTLEFKIDTRVPVMMIHWKNIGKVTLLFEDEECKDRNGNRTTISIR